jgi:hypothetical protein
MTHENDAAIAQAAALLKTSTNQGGADALVLEFWQHSQRTQPQAWQPRIGIIECGRTKEDVTNHASIEHGDQREDCLAVVTQSIDDISLVLSHSSQNNVANGNDIVRFFRANDNL